MWLRILEPDFNYEPTAANSSSDHLSEVSHLLFCSVLFLSMYVLLSTPVLPSFLFLYHTIHFPHTHYSTNLYNPPNSISILSLSSWSTQQVTQNRRTWPLRMVMEGRRDWDKSQIIIMANKYYNWEKEVKS